jgi:hypothetical protein
VAFTTVARGTDSQITEPREVVVRSADEWQTLWRAHSAERAPAVDFSRFTVAAIFLGTRMTAGYSAEIVRVRDAGGISTVEYREQQPPAGSLNAQVLTAPFHIVRIPRREGQIEFRRLLER